MSVQEKHKQLVDKQMDQMVLQRPLQTKKVCLTIEVEESSADLFYHHLQAQVTDRNLCSIAEFAHRKKLQIHSSNIGFP